MILMYQIGTSRMLCSLWQGFCTVCRMKNPAFDETRKKAYLWGKSCENEARDWFQARHTGARCLAQNLHSYRGELDLIFEIPSERLLVFVEVKARAGAEGTIESLGFTKQRRLKHAIDHYLLSYRGLAREIRIDVLGLEGGEWKHWKNIRIADY